MKELHELHKSYQYDIIIQGKISSFLVVLFNPRGKNILRSKLKLNTNDILAGNSAWSRTHHKDYLEPMPPTKRTNFPPQIAVFNDSRISSLCFIELEETLLNLKWIERNYSTSESLPRFEPGTPFYKKFFNISIHSSPNSSPEQHVGIISKSWICYFMHSS